MMFKCAASDSPLLLSLPAEVQIRWQSEEYLFLNNGGDALPPPNNTHAQKALLEDFKGIHFLLYAPHIIIPNIYHSASTVSVTALYRSALKASKQSCNQDYLAVRREILKRTQHGLADDNRRTHLVRRPCHGLARARLDAIRAREEEEDESESDLASGGPSSSGSKHAPLPRANSAPVFFAAARAPNDHVRLPRISLTPLY